MGASQAALRKHLTKRIVSYLNPDPERSQFEQSRAFMNGVNQVAEAFRPKFKITARGMSRSFWVDDPEQLAKVCSLPWLNRTASYKLTSHLDAPRPRPRPPHPKRRFPRRRNLARRLPGPRCPTLLRPPPLRRRRSPACLFPPNLAHHIHYHTPCLGA